MTADIVQDKATLEPSFENDLRDAIYLVERGALNNEPRFIYQALKKTLKHRRLFKGPELQQAVSQYLDACTDLGQKSVKALELCSASLPSSQSDSCPSKSHTSSSAAPASTLVVREISLFVGLLVLVWEHDNLRSFDSGLHMDDKHRADLETQALDFADTLVKVAKGVQGVAAGVLRSKIYFFFSRIHELNGKLSQVRFVLLDLLRASTYYKDNETTATLITLLLRNFLVQCQYDDADKLISNTEFPKDVSYTQQARYHYYVGCIKAIRLDYQDALAHMEEACRVTPRENAVGFYQATTKWHIVIQLLFGIIPTRSIFRNRVFKAYFGITRAIYAGNIAEFEAQIALYEAHYKKDKLYHLVTRLRDSVMKSGIKKIFAAYERISLSDVASKLCLQSELDAEYVILKAIKENLVVGTIDHEQRTLTTLSQKTGAQTLDALGKFDARSLQLLNLHNEAQLRMRYSTSEKIKKGPLEASSTVSAKLATAKPASSPPSQESK